MNNVKILSISWRAALLAVAAFCALADESREAHKLKLIAGVKPVKDKDAPLFNMDGRVYSWNDSPPPNLPANSLLHVYFPDEIPLDLDSFPPFSDMEIPWLYHHVQFCFHYKGKIIPSHTMILRLPPRANGVEAIKLATVFLDGKEYGIGEPVLDKMAEWKWESPSILILYYSHDEPEDPSGWFLRRADEFVAALERRGVRVVWYEEWKRKPK